MKNISLREAVKFHGHLGPYLILGLLAGNYALKKLKCKKYFSLDVSVCGAIQKPKSCLVDGLQLSTGATYGKGNIRRLNGRKISIICRNVKNDKRISLQLNKDLAQRLAELKGHRKSESFARGLLKINPRDLFNLSTKE